MKQAGRVVIGIDIGSTTTKAVAFLGDGSNIKLTTKAVDPITSASGALGKMILENGLSISDVDHVVLTGVGSSKIKGNLFDIPTTSVEEIQAIGLGGMFLSGRDNVMIANIGTGTAMVEASHDGVRHVGGTGVGGGTLLGLAKAMLHVSDISTLFALAETGRINQVDLLIEDIVDSDISFLKKEMTAANFGKVLDTAKDEDIALGIVNMVYQVIGMLSVFAARSRNLGAVIVTGNGSNAAVGKRILDVIAHMYAIEFIHPIDAEYATAIGAALTYCKEASCDEPEA
jgi:type II pantothenate kinase